MQQFTNDEPDGNGQSAMAAWERVTTASAPFADAAAAVRNWKE